MNRTVAVLILTMLSLNTCASPTSTEVATTIETEVVMDAESGLDGVTESENAQVLRGLGYRQMHSLKINLISTFP